MGLAGIEGQHISAQAGEARWLEALSIAREHHGEDPTSEADALRGFAMMWLETGDPARAEPLVKRSLKILETEPAATDWQLASTLAATGQVYRTQDKLSLAEDAWTRALELDRKAFGDAHPQVAYMMERLAEVYAARRQFDLARQYSGKAIEVMRSSCGEDSLAVAAALANRGLVEEYAKALPAAADDYASALEIARKHPANSALWASIIRNYTAVLRAIHHDREANALALELKSFH
jgi:tetratricopeptide (TPR) repeat protein